MRAVELGLVEVAGHAEAQVASAAGEEQIEAELGAEEQRRIEAVFAAEQVLRTEAVLVAAEEVLQTEVVWG